MAEVKNNEAIDPILESFLKLAPLLNELIVEDVTIGVCDTEKFLLSVPGKTFSLGIEPGTPLVEGDAITNAIKNKRVEADFIPEDVLGMPIIARAMPLYSESGSVVGGVGFGVSMEQYNTLSKIANSLSESIEQITATMEELASSTTVLSESVQHLSDQSSQVLDGVKEIEDVTNTVRKISENSHILGLNASIEAARAGEHGKGFSVVAGEVRKLAGISKQHTEEIKETVKNINILIENLDSSISSINAETTNQSTVAEEMSATMIDMSQNSSKLAEVAERALRGTN